MRIRALILGSSLLVLLVSAALWLVHQDDQDTSLDTTARTAPAIPVLWSLAGTRAPAASQPSGHRPAPKVPLAVVRDLLAAGARPNSYSEKTLHRFAGAEILAVYDSPADEEGNFLHHQLLRTDFKYSLVNMREHWQIDPETGEKSLRGRDAVVADHVMASLAPGASPAQFQTFLAENHLSILKELPGTGLYLITFDAHDPQALEQTVALLRGHPELIDKSAPDYIAFNN